MTELPMRAFVRSVCGFIAVYSFLRSVLSIRTGGGLAHASGVPVRSSYRDGGENCLGAHCVAIIEPLITVYISVD